MSGWTHDEAKQHTIVERLWERCSAYGTGEPCHEYAPDFPRENWCERCLAADLLIELGADKRRA